jgi:8-amino-7-oxononanoate synthase
VDGQPLLQFCSNDYLAWPATRPWRGGLHRRLGLWRGLGGSPMVNGSTANAALEADLARFVQLPRALYFYAGFATNASVIPALVGRATPSSRTPEPRQPDRRLPAVARQHPPLSRMAISLRWMRCWLQPGQRKLVVSDAVFSMDGNVADIEACWPCASATMPC